MVTHLQYPEASYDYGMRSALFCEFRQGIFVFIGVEIFFDFIFSFVFQRNIILLLIKNSSADVLSRISQ
ncbi:hypothetical protein DYE48_00210 [Halobacillus trueperi]|uniref:Uncharacterized protein n=1 Tax=Halobacillus trueperi TaxID=156205 RepID=A0A3E0JD37_9BACI|nr:hypothetical protein DYE48_00210 [Halobacillus trueperi]